MVGWSKHLGLRNLSLSASPSNYHAKIFIMQPLFLIHHHLSLLPIGFHGSHGLQSSQNPIGTQIIIVVLMCCQSCAFNCFGWINLLVLTNDG
jgi:hypothetical protein